MLNGHEQTECLTYEVSSNNIFMQSNKGPSRQAWPAQHNHTKHWQRPRVPLMEALGTSRSLFG